MPMTTGRAKELAIAAMDSGNNKMAKHYISIMESNFKIKVNKYEELEDRYYAFKHRVKSIADAM